MEAVTPAAPPASRITSDSRRMDAVVPARLRADVIIRRQFFKRREYYVIKDPLALTYFRLQPEEAYLLTQLDGKRTLLQISQNFSQRYPNQARSVVELAQFVNQLGAGGLLSVSAGRFVEHAQKTVPQKMITVWAKLISHVLFLKIPLVDPSPWLGRLAHALRFLWTKWFVGAAIMLFVWTAVLLLINANEFATRRIDFFSASNLLLLWLMIVVIKTLHEFGHATTCRHFGGEVHEMGVCLMLFTPCGYVDASDAWMMRHKRHKLFVTVAGVFTELVLACVAAHLWLVLPDGIGRSLAFNAMIVASINTVVFNINPLMRFDGYYVVCDLLEIPNLRSKAMTFCSYHLQRFFLGYRNRQQEGQFEQEADGRVFVGYAVLAYLYMITIIYGITQIFGRILAPIGLREFGLYLGYFVEGSFVALPFIKVFMDAFKPGTHIVKTGSVRRRLTVIFGSLAAAIGVCFVTPSRYHVSQQAVVISSAFEGVASEVGGVISAVHVRTGQWVDPGDLLVSLENPEVSAELEVSEATRQQTRVRFSAMRQAGGWKVAEGQAGAAQELEVAEAGYQFAAARAAKLQIRATTAGFVLTPNVEKLTGSYAPPLALILRLGDTRRVRLVVPLTEDESQLVERGSSVTGRWLATARSFETELDSVSSQPAQPEELQLGMLAYFGGAVPSDALHQEHRQGTRYPIFLASAPVDKPEHLVLEGLRVRVTIEGKTTTLGLKAWRRVASWFNLRASTG